MEAVLLCVYDPRVLIIFFFAFKSIRRELQLRLSMNRKQWARSLLVLFYWHLTKQLCTALSIDIFGLFAIWKPSYGILAWSNCEPRRWKKASSRRWYKQCKGPAFLFSIRTPSFFHLEKLNRLRSRMVRKDGDLCNSRIVRFLDLSSLPSVPSPGLRARRRPSGELNGRK